MGAQQSSSSSEKIAQEKAILERLRSVQLGIAEDDYVNIDNGGSSKEKGYSLDLQQREPEGLSVQIVRTWQSIFLQNPKNRFVPFPFRQSSWLS
jgi:hypothetical protein